MSNLYKDRALADIAADKLKVYAQPQRLMILSFLLDGEKSVSDIDEATAIGQPALSQQLAALRRAELVKTRRVAKQVYYEINDTLTEICLRSMEIIFDNDNKAPIETLKQMIATNETTNISPSRTIGAASFAKIA